MATLNPFSNANVLEHIVSPKITGPSGGAYQVDVDLVDIDTVYSRQIGSATKKVQDLFVNRLYWNTFVPALPGTGGGTGATGTTGSSSIFILAGGTGISTSTSGITTTISSLISGGTGISISTRPNGTNIEYVINSSAITGGTGISVTSVGNTYAISSTSKFVAGSGMTIAQAGDTYTFTSFSPISTPGPTGQITYYGGGGLTSSSLVTFDGTSVTLPTTITDARSNNGILRTTTQSGNAYLQPGTFNVPNSASTLLVTPVNGGTSTLAVNTGTSRVGVNIDVPTTTLDVYGQTQITYNSSNGANILNSVVASGISGTFTAGVGTYTIQGWGGGGAGNGGTGGAGGFYSATLNISSGGTFSWGPAFGGANGGGNALSLSFGGNTTLIVPGGGAGITGGIGAAAGTVRGMPIAEAGLSPGSGLTAIATYTDTRNWGYRFSNSIGLTGATFTSGTISALTSLAQPGTTVTFTPGASQISSQAGATYTVPVGTTVTITPNNMLFTGTSFSSADTLAILPTVPINVVDGGTGIAAAVGTGVAIYDYWPGVTLPAITGNPTISTVGTTFAFGTPNVTWKTGILSFTTITPYSFFFNGVISDSGPVGNNVITLNGAGNITTNQPLPTITNAELSVSSVTVPPNSIVQVLSRTFINYGQPATGRTGSTGAGGGATGGGSAALVTGILGGMTANTPGNQAAGGGAGSGLYSNVAGLSYVGTPVSQPGIGIYPYLTQYNQNAIYGIGGTGNSTVSGNPYLVIQQVTTPATPQSALIVNGNGLVNGVLTVNNSITLGNTPGANVQIIPDGANGIQIAGVNGYSVNPPANVAMSGALTVVGTSNLRGNSAIGVIGGFNAGLSVGSNPVGGTPGPGDINATGTVRGITLSASNAVTAPVISGGSLTMTGVVNLEGNTRIGRIGLFNAWLTVGSAPVFAPNGGDIVATNNVYGVDLIATSDVRTKNSIETVESALDKVMKMRGVFFERNTEPGERRVGVIAQEIEEVLPEVVYTDSDGMKSVSYGSIIGVLIEAIKELSTK
jgi:hypothetical protein